MTGLPDYRLAKIAQEELIEIVSSGIEKFGQTVSAAYVTGMFETFELLSDHTMMGRKGPVPPLSGAIPFGAMSSFTKARHLAF